MDKKIFEAEEQVSLPPKALDSRWIWISLGLVSILIRSLLNFSPGFTETFYSRGFFQMVRWIFDHSLTLLPFPLFYPGLILFIALLLRWFWRSRKRNKGKGFVFRSKQAVVSLLALAGALIFFFQFLWGFNYARIPVEKQLGLILSPLDSQEVKKELDWILEACMDVRNSLPGSKEDTALEFTYDQADLEKESRKALESLLTDLGYPTTGRVRGRLLKPKGSLLRFGTAGIYIPFFGEGNVDSGMHPLTYPYTLTHEMSHGYGFGNEGTCNFLALLACIRAENPHIQYSGLIGHLRYLLGAYRIFIPDYQSFRAELPMGIQMDLNAINQANARFPDWIPGYRINNVFLKSQGIKEGIKSYNRVVLLVAAWKRSIEGQ